jgi:hypothetical protein
MELLLNRARWLNPSGKRQTALKQQQFQPPILAHCKLPAVLSAE